MEELLFKWGVDPNACQQCAAIAAVAKYFAGDVAEVVFELVPRILGPIRFPCGRSDAVGLLLECGADSAAENECRLTPLELAVKMDVGEAAGVSRLLPESRRRFFVELKWVFNSSIFFRVSSPWNRSVVM
jgi:hypothetical protein